MWKKAINRESLKKLIALSILKKVLVFALLFMASDAFAKTCEAGFEDTLHIKVIDRHYRPIEGALVNVSYQKDQSTGKGFVTTNTQYTGADGKVTETIRNTELFDSKVDCGITIQAEYDGVIVTRKIDANAHSAEIQLRFEDAYLLGLTVIDKYGQPIANTTVKINEMYRDTGETGYVGVIVNAGTVDVAVPYLHGVLTEEIIIVDDTIYTLRARVYPFALSVVDDLGQPLVADIFVENEEFYSSGVDIAEMALPTPSVRVVYGSIEKTVAVNLAEETEYVVSFDLTPPEITNVNIVREGDDIKITFYIHDPNVLASGPNLDETTVTYTIGGVTQSGVPYAESGAYAVEIPAPPTNTLLRFTITTHDMEGNMNTLNGEYLITPEEEEDDPPSVEENGETEVPVEEEGGNLILIIVGIVVVLAFAYAVWSYIRGLSEEE